MSNDLLVDAQIASAQTLPGWFYSHAELFERSRQRVFARSWQWLGDTDQLKAPGSVQPITLLEGMLDEPLVICRDHHDQLHLLSNVCTHRGMLVAEHGGNERFLRCRYHGRRFGLDGCFQAMPEFEGVEGFPSPADSLPRVAHALWGQDKFLFGSLEPQASLEEVLAPISQRLGWLPLREFFFEASRAREYLVRAHWALYVDNYLEGFHIPFIHASLNTSLDYGQYATELFDWGNLQLGIAADGEPAFDLPRSSPDHGRRVAAYYYWIYPNLMLNFYPWGLSINLVRPLGPALTKVQFLPYVWDASKLAEGAGAALDRVEREDEVVVEAVQRGLASRLYRRGRFSVAREAGVHQFHRLLGQQLLV